MIFYYSATRGLIKSNLKAYFHARSRNYDVLDALEFMLESRFPREPYIAQNILSGYMLQAMVHDQEDLIRRIIWEIFVHENGVPPNPRKWMDKFSGWFDKIYPKLHLDFTGHLPQEE